MLKYKVGATLIITDRTDGHRFNIGELVVVERCFPDNIDPHYEARSLEREEQVWYIGDNEVVKMK